MRNDDLAEIKPVSENLSIECAVLICNLANRIQTQIDNEIRGLELAHSQYRYLKYLYEHGKNRISMKEIHRYLSISRPSVSRMTASLADKNFICIEKSKTDDREKYITITAKGETAYLRAKNIPYNTQSPLDDNELTALYELLNKLNSSV